MFTIRSITQSDIPTIAQIESSVHAYPWTEKMFNDCFEPKSGDLGYAGYVLEIADELRKAEDSREPEESNKCKEICAYLITQVILDECHILTIGVEKKHQNEGYATQLLEYLFKRQSVAYGSDTLNSERLNSGSFSSGVQRILLEVRESNQSAIHLYKKLGFECIADRKNYYMASNGLQENALIFEKI